MLLVDLVFPLQAAKEWIRNVEPWQKRSFVLFINGQFRYNLNTLFLLLVIHCFVSCGSEVIGSSSLHFFTRRCQECLHQRAVHDSTLTHRARHAHIVFIFYFVAYDFFFYKSLALLDCVCCLLLCLTISGQESLCLSNRRQTSMNLRAFQWRSWNGLFCSVTLTVRFHLFFFLIFCVSYPLFDPKWNGILKDVFWCCWCHFKSGKWERLRVLKKSVYFSDLTLYFFGTMVTLLFTWCVSI